MFANVRSNTRTRAASPAQGFIRFGVSDEQHARIDELRSQDDGCRTAFLAAAAASAFDPLRTLAISGSLGPLGVNARSAAMSVKVIRATSNPILIAAGIALFLLAIVGTQAAVANANHYRVPTVVLAGGAIMDAMLGAALLFVGLRRSRYAGVTAVVVASFLLFGLGMKVVASVAFRAPFQVTWGNAIILSIAAAILWPSVFPWSRSANRPVFFWMGLTFGAMTLLLGTVVLLARL